MEAEHTTTEIHDDSSETEPTKPKPENSNKLVYLSILAIIPVILIVALIFCYCKLKGKIHAGKTDPDNGTKSAPPSFYTIRAASVSDVVVKS